jgi:hypothetical protein
VSVSAADKLRRWVVLLSGHSPIELNRCADEQAAADLLDAIDALHQPIGHDGLYIFDCADCGQAWPCKTHRLLHPKEAHRG